MPSTLNPETLKTLREKNNLTQAELAELCHCQSETVGRWERGESKIRRQRYKDGLCKALGVTWEALCRPYQAGNDTKANRVVDDGREAILRNLNARVSHHAHQAFTLASQRYGCRIADIVELAPLLFMIAAEQSLADREEKRSALHDKRKEYEEMQDELPQFASVISVDNELDEIDTAEQKAIEQRKVFGCDHWRPWDWNSPDNDPFARYLRRLVEATHLEPGIVKNIESGDDRAPTYRLGIDALKTITGLTGDTEQEQRVLDVIGAGWHDFREVVTQQRTLPTSEFQEWLGSWGHPIILDI
jgi:transcriptional regulator with XRE-family HTH domain